MRQATAKFIKNAILFKYLKYKISFKKIYLKQGLESFSFWRFWFEIFLKFRFWNRFF